MKPVLVKDNIYWVGAIDWDVRDFHGYKTQRGSTYNAYLVIDEKITLIDTVKHYLFDEMLARISQVVNPSKIDYIISNHVEMDHSGSLPKLMKVADNAQLYTSPNGEKGLNAHYKNDWNFTVVKSGDSLNIGERSLSFVQTPMVHWPDNMVSYMPEEKMLFSNDAFGQHIASAERFDDQIPLDIVIEEAQKYYANIVLPYGAQVQKALEAASGLEIETICPSHGLIWRSKIPAILKEYVKWAGNETQEKAVIIYDSMWNSTKQIAYAVQSAFESKGIITQMRSLKSTHISDIMTDVITSKYICVGSPTLNNGILPSVSAFLTYMKGLAPKKRIGLAFGSYGWSGESVGVVEEILKNCKFEMLDNIRIKYVPNEDDLQEVTENLLKTL
ncbi:FprA family A-type flavoprotein [Candidatus Contubernalis alkaliaceticus]|uniref:FprA family A-type flavoprotein n=1 Tax=Candidatus Contubernalis alkaliaceticus TaxID=338645 RepID=UPI001F4C3252|nr:FprA family A-type flavoprotein [Candidatus Contubernalis alkalaceticus]UNC92248.1 FprA family A-type flavoprotein [Candidatus Contubernalis alkalaceticus]